MPRKQPKFTYGAGDSPGSPLFANYGNNTKSILVAKHRRLEELKTTYTTLTRRMAAQLTPEQIENITRIIAQYDARQLTDEFRQEVFGVLDGLPEDLQQDLINMQATKMAIRDLKINLGIKNDDTAELNPLIALINEVDGGQHRMGTDG